MLLKRSNLRKLEKKKIASRWAKTAYFEEDLTDEGSGGTLMYGPQMCCLRGPALPFIQLHGACIKMKMP